MLPCPPPNPMSCPLGSPRQVHARALHGVLQRRGEQRGLQPEGGLPAVEERESAARLQPAAIAASTATKLRSGSTVCA